MRVDDLVSRAGPCRKSFESREKNPRVPPNPLSDCERADISMREDWVSGVLRLIQPASSVRQNWK